jgi:RNA polymerase primary sigma factor
MNKANHHPRQPLPPLFRMAALLGATATVQLHIKLADNVDAVDEKGRSPLMLAASKGHAEVCRLLLNAGADIALKDGDGNDALVLAEGRPEVSELLRKARDGVLPPSQLTEPAPKELTKEMNSGRLIFPELPADSCSEPATIRLPEKTLASSDTPCLIDQGNREATSGFSVFEHELSPRSHCNLVSTPSPLDSGDGDTIDLSEWEEEGERAPPPDDPSCIVGAAAVQGRISRHVLTDADESWDEIDLDLPEILAPGRRGAKLSENEEQELRKLIMQALRDGRLQHWRIVAASPSDPDDSLVANQAFVSNLRMVLGDLGVIIDDDPVRSDFENDAEADDEHDDANEERFGDDVQRALVFLQRLNSNETELLTSYVRNLPNFPLDRKTENDLGLAIEEGMKDALAAVARSPAAIAILSSTAEGVINGEIALEAMIDADGIGGSLAEELRPEDGETRQDPEFDVESLEGKPLTPEILSRIVVVRDLCQRLSASELIPDITNLSKALGNHLFALGLSPTFVAKLDQLVEEDVQGADARQFVKIGLEKARSAKARLVEGNLRLVLWVAKRYGALTLMDRIQEGTLGLLKAAERFDPHRGTKFSTYAIWWIRQSITRAIADQGRTIRVPVHVVENLAKIRKAQRDSVYARGVEAKPEEISRLTEFSLEKVKRLLEIPEEPLSFDNDEVPSLADQFIDDRTPSPMETTVASIVRIEVTKLLECLPPREAEVIDMRFGLNGNQEHTLEEIGTLFGVTRERIRQIEAAALKRLGHPGRANHLLELLRSSHSNVCR